MAITITRINGPLATAKPSDTSTTPATAPKPKRGAGGVVPKAPMISLDQPGRLRVANVMALFGISSANTFYTRVHQGRIPPADGRDPRPYWNTATIREALATKK